MARQNQTREPKEKALRDKQQAFIAHYLACLNATEAARRAGYSEKTAHAIGWENLRKPEIRAAIDARLKELHLSSDEVLARLSEMAVADMDDFITPIKGGARLDIRKAKERGKLHLVKKFSKGKNGTSIELHDAQAALVQLGRYHGLFVDKLAPTDPSGKKEYAGLTDDERAARIAAILERARARRDGSTDPDGEAAG